MTERPAAPPEGELITAALAKSGLTQKDAAKLAGIGASRWRQIITGYQSVAGRKVGIKGPAGRVALMAHAVGVTPAELDAAGRPDAAAALSELLAEATGQHSTDPASLQGNSPARVDERWHMLEAVLRQADHDLSPAEHSALLDRIKVYFAGDPEWQSLSDAPAREEQQPDQARQVY